jgi:hypothetical protein
LIKCSNDHKGEAVVEEVVAVEREVVADQQAHQQHHHSHQML